MNEQELMEKIQQSFKVAFGTDPSLVTIDAKPENIPGWDSLGHATLTLSLEKTFNVTFDIDELMAMEDVAAIIEVMRNKIT
ncbi:acyl carrier protein [Candidatus Ferrigenium straubiae]|jgi:acyl carrier protein|uniref:acyl carrier protein n=1 Tax=Candidatus Ferrigenium straubiae TaxID=2919506 RepID=UPI003F4A879D